MSWFTCASCVSKKTHFIEVRVNERTKRMNGFRKGKYGWMDGWMMDGWMTKTMCFNTSSVSGLDASSICSGRRGSDMLTTKSCNKKYPITIQSLHNDYILSTSLIMELLIICCLSIIILIHVYIHVDLYYQWCFTIISLWFERNYSRNWMELSLGIMLEMCLLHRV